MTTKRQFEDFLHDIEPSSTTKSNGQKAHTALRDFLAKHEKYSGINLGTFLSGSYKRDTAIRPQIKDGKETKPDIDIIVVTNHSLFETCQDVINLLHSTLKDYEKQERKKNRDIEVRKQTRSVAVNTNLVDMDVVPIVAPDGLDARMYIPDRKLSKWLETNPPKHTEWTTRMNKKAGGRFKPLVKLVKWWRRENPTIATKPKGFMIECIVAQCMSFSEKDYAELFVGTLESIVAQYGTYVTIGVVPSIEDPAVTSNSVTSSVSFDAFQGFYNKVKNHANLGRKAIQEDDNDKSTEIWRRIFGTHFPISKSESVGLLRSSSVAAPGAFPDKPLKPVRDRGFA